MPQRVLRASRICILCLTIAVLGLGASGCAVTKKPKGCGCGMEERMGGRS